MLDFYFDRLIKEKLHFFEVPFDGKDWELFVAAMNELEESHDEAIREKLVNHTVSYQPEDWKLLEASLHGAFDTSVREGLESIEAGYNPADWHEMESKLSAPFDTLVREKLTQHRVPFRGRDWRNMLARLQGNTIGMPWYKDRKVQVAAAALALLLGISGIFRVERNSTFLPKNISSNSVSENLIVLPESEVSEQDFSDIAPAEYTQQTQVAQTGLTRNDKSDVVLEAAVIAEDDLKKDFGKMAYQSSDSQTNEEDFYTDQLEKSAIFSIVRFNPRENIISSDLPDLENSENLPDFNRSRLKPTVRFGLLAGQSYSRAELNDNAETGFMLGVRVELELNREWSVVSGINYEEKSYTHRFLEFPKRGPTIQKYLEADFQTLEIPTLVRYEFPSKSNLSLYLQGGVSTMITIEENYESKEHEDAELFRMIPTTPSERDLQAYFGDILVAAGFEYVLTKHLSLQFEPFFRIGMNRMGPEEKKLYTTGLTLNFMYNPKAKKLKPAIRM